ncbi:MAG TPA: D-alanyl-D-alanine carboxypeptidase family protein [Ornithinibacter sp.]|nr:D-alanyl-D-alanine carboxypeptidase family protein [Ornithinibacter sp.]
MTAPEPRHLALAAVAVVAVAGLGLAVAGPLTPSEPPARSVPPAASPPPSASTSPSATPSPSPSAVAALPRTRPPQGRLAGDDLYAMSVAASRAAFPGTARAPVVFLVSGESQAQAYGAVPAAAALGGAVLLTRPDGIPRVTAAELDRLDPDRIVLVGGGTVIRAAVARAAATHAPDVERVDGDSRAGTSLALARFAFGTATKAWVVSRDHPEHAVVAAAAAAGQRSPVLVVDGDAAALPAAHAALLRDLGATDVTVVGPTSAVSTGIADDLEDLVGSGGVRRASGADRYAVAAKVNALARPSLSEGVAYLANGRKPTTAFVGAFLAGLSQRPLHYSLPYCVPASVRPALVGTGVSRVVLVGGESSVRRLAGRLEPCRSIEDPSSTWVLVNKRNGLSPRGFVPSDLRVPAMEHAGGHELRADAAKALATMAAASVDAGVGRIGIDTAFRSYATQDALYDSRVASRGRAWADTWYLRPGYSEHQTGLTVDLLPIGRSNCTINDCIDETPQGVWLARNAWRHGFILRYERGHTSTTGVGFEPWHFRYVGKPLAEAYRDGGWNTLEAFLDEPAAPSY